MTTLSRTTSAIILAASAWWWAVFLAMHILEPEFDPLRAPGSAYVLGAYGGWARTSYLALSAVLISAGLGLAANLPATVLTRVALWAFFTAGAGAVLAGLFSMDFPGPPRTVSGWLHAAGGLLAFLPWPVGTFLFSLSIRRDIDGNDAREHGSRSPLSKLVSWHCCSYRLFFSALAVMRSGCFSRCSLRG